MIFLGWSSASLFSSLALVLLIFVRNITDKVSKYFLVYMCNTRLYDVFQALTIFYFLSV